MNFFFLTRCYQPGNIQRIKDNLAEVFAGTGHNYYHYLVIDLTHGATSADFAPFIDARTDATFIHEKPEKDTQNTFGMNYALRFVKPDEYVYVLDDDNLLHPRFPEVAEKAENSDFFDAVVFKIEGRPELGNLIMQGENPVGRIDWANFITKGETMKRVGLNDCLNPPRCEDGIFFSKLLACGHYHIKWVDEVLAYYNKLPRLG